MIPLFDHWMKRIPAAKPNQRLVNHQNMASPTSDTLHQHIFSAIDPMRGSLPSHVIAVISRTIPSIYC